jgi:hypothetical protein
VGCKSDPRVRPLILFSIRPIESIPGRAKQTSALPMRLQIVTNDNKRFLICKTPLITATTTTTSLVSSSPHDLLFSVCVSPPHVAANSLALVHHLANGTVFCLVGAPTSSLTENPASRYGTGCQCPIAPNPPPASLVPSSFMDSQPNKALYPGSDLSTSQLLAALDRKIPTEIAWLESNARSRGILAHFRKPEV